MTLSMILTHLALVVAALVFAIPVSYTHLRAHET